MRLQTTVWCLLLAMAGCAAKLKPIFEERRSALVWPPGPARPRIRYVGQLRTSTDLKPRPKPLQAIGDLLVGKKKPEPFYGPRAAICTSGGTRLWVADPGGRCLHLLDLNDRVYKKVERVGGSRLISPVGLAAGPEGSVYVCDSESVAIHRLSADSGVWLESLRLPEDLQRPVALMYDEAAGELWVVDVIGHDIKVLGRDGSLRRIIGRRGNAPGEFNFPCDVTADGDRIWVVDAGNHRVQALSRQGEPVISFGQAGDATGDLALPKAVAVDSDGHLYVVDARFENIQVFDRSGRLLLVFGEEGTGPGEFWLPAGIFVDEKDRIWICDSYNRRVQVFEYIRVQGAKDSRVRGSEGSRIRGAKGSRVRGFEDSRSQGFEGSRIRGSEDSRIRGARGSRIRGFEEPRVRGFGG